jgi:hypothetical protein
VTPVTGLALRGRLWAFLAHAVPALSIPKKENAGLR